MATAKSTKKTTAASRARAKRDAERYGYETTVDEKNKKGKSYKQREVKNADAKKDSKRSALRAGKRTTAWGTEYYETRVNRSDKGKKR